MKGADAGKNWAGNYQYTAKGLYRPADVSEIQQLVKSLTKIKALGSRHCFNDIADSESLISTENLKTVDIDEAAMTVTVGAGLRYGDFCAELNARGFALHNMASLPHISVVGACATATHGSGVNNGNLGTAVSGLEFVAGTGELIALDLKRNEDLLNGAIVNLGGIGVITKVTLDIEKTFAVRQDVFQGLALAQLADNFVEIMSSGYSVSLFTDWQNEKIDQVWVKRRIDENTAELSASFFGAKAAAADLHPLQGISAENCTEQMGLTGNWHDRLPHFKMGFTPSSGEELQSEYFIPRENAVAAIFAIERLSSLIGPHLLVSEIRTIAADRQWMSPCYLRDCIAIHFTWKPDAAAVGKILPNIEAALAPFNAVPHWGKLFTTSPEVLRSIYKKLPDFIELLTLYDPEGKFRNAYMERLIFQ